MSENADYSPDFEAERIPAWFLDTDETVAYHLYPDCGHINHHPERGLSKMTLPFQSSSMGSFEDWKEQIKSNRHMCKHCTSRFTSEWFRYDLENGN